MELLLLIAFIIIIIMLINVQGRLRSNSDTIKRDFAALKNQLSEVKQELDGIRKLPEPKPADTAQQQQEKEAADKKALEEYQQKIAGLEELRRQREERRKQEAGEQVPARPVVSFHVHETIEAPQATATKQAPAPKESWLEKWLRNNPDLEKFIGENLFNKIGIAVLVFGIAFFVKYAIDQNWINEYGRVAIGMGCGIILTALAHRLRNTYRSFSSVLAGGGLAVFYFTIALAFHQYHIVSQQAAFVLMTIITAFAVLLAVLYNRIELGVIAVAGGFLTPFMVSTGQGNYIVLFSYLIILNAGLLVLSWFKKWRLINILAFFFTIIIYGGWMLDTFLFKSGTPPYANAFLFATVFYFLFLGMNMLYNIRRMQHFKAWDFTILLLINATYFAAGMVILSAWHDGLYKGAFTIGVGFINFLLAFYFFRARNTDRNLLYLLIGLTLTFLSLTAPVQLHGHSITLFWCAEMVLLLWLHLRSGITIFKTSSVIISGLMLLSLFMDWDNASHYNSSLPVIFSSVKGIVTNIMAVAAFTCYALLLKASKENPVFLSGLRFKAAGNMAAAVAIVLAYITVYFCINLYFVNETGYVLPGIYHRMLSYITALLLLLFAVNPNNKNAYWQRLVPLLGCFIFYAGSTALINALREDIIHSQTAWYHLLFHWAGDVLLLYIIFKTISEVRRHQLQYKQTALLSWVFSFMTVFVISFECMQLYTVSLKNTATPEVLLRQYLRAGLTILWGLSSFALMWLGMRHRYKTLRIISITLFGIALLKLFLSDITDIGPGGKIAAFILLGVLLLVVSFMYQRLKKILLDDKTEQ